MLTKRYLSLLETYLSSRIFFSKKLSLAVKRQGMALNYLLSLPFIFLLALLVSTILYYIGSLISQKVKQTKRSGKLEPYACGESLPAKKLQINIERFFLYVTLFLIFDVTAFLLSLSFNANFMYPIIFIAIITSSLLILIPEIRRGKSCLLYTSPSPRD